MCGIASIYSSQKIDQAQGILDKFAETLHHRGPDGNGTWINKEGNLGLAHTRLAIIDLREESSQPFISSDQRIALTFNGEIYNYKELREECIKLGSTFKSEGDTEVIVECYRHFGKDCVSKFRGMWAFLLYDQESGEIFISRDPFGIKPLFYGVHKGQVIFASEIKAFHAVDQYFLEEDKDSLKLFRDLKLYDRGNWTFYKNIKRFPHAHNLHFQIGHNFQSLKDFRFERYWRAKRERVNLSLDKAIEKLRELFKASVNLHMRSDVPVGFCLSGGVDSSAIVCMAKHLNPDVQLNTFTTRFNNHAEIDETKWAEMVNQHTDSKSHYIDPTGANFKEDLDTVLSFQDEPFGAASIYSQYCIFRGISKAGVKVVLDGQGADEAFSGYHSFFSYYLYSLLKEFRFIRFFQMAFLFKKNHNYQYPILKTIKQFLLSGLRKWKRKTTSKEFSLDYHNVEEEDTYDKRVSFLLQPIESFDDFLEFMVCEGNVPSLLRFEDRNSMAFSIESRVPFLVNELMDFSLSVSHDYKLKNGITKYILRESMRGYAPDPIIDRSDKLGFPAPDKKWMKEFYNKDVKGPFSDEWCDLVIERWRVMNTERQKSSLNVL